jgi:hypothetical protein
MRKLSLWLVCLIVSVFTLSCKDDLESMSSMSEGNEGGSVSSLRVSAAGDQHDVALTSSVAILNAMSATNTFWGDQTSIKNGTALATIAVEVANGSTNATYKNLYVAKLKEILSGTVITNQCVVTGNIQHREGAGIYLALALAWNTPSIKSSLTIPEQTRLQLTMKATLVACAYVMADYTSNLTDGGTNRPSGRLDMVGKLLFTSPNYAEAYAGSFLYAMSVLGKNTIFTFLNGYNHATFISDLNSNGLTRISDKFSTNFNITEGTLIYDASTAIKKAQLIEGYVRNIDNNETIGRLFFKGISLTSIISDPINLTAQLNTECFDKNAREGEYAGQLGMASEFMGGDKGGVRDDLYYSTTGVFIDLYNRYLVEKVGYWSASAQSAKKNEIDRRLKVGFSDINPKAWNGYLSYRNAHKPPPDGGYAFYSLVKTQTGEGWWQRIHDLAKGMGLAKEYILHDSFGDGNYSSFPSWSAINGSWTTFPIVQSFTGYTSPTITRPTEDTVIASNASNATARLITAYSASNYDITVQCKVETFGTNGKVGIIGRSNNIGGTTSNKNYYLINFDNTTKAWKIDKYTNGVVSNLSNTSVSSAPTKQIVAGLTNDVYFIRASFNGGAIKIYLNNIFIASVQDSNALITTGSIGLYTSNTKALFDDVYVNQP